MTYRSDEHGFRNPAGVHDSQDVSIAVLGDSFAHGYWVESEDSIAGVLRSRYRDTINLAFDDGGPLTMLAALKEYARPLRLGAHVDRDLRQRLSIPRLT